MRFSIPSSDLSFHAEVVEISIKVRQVLLNASWICPRIPVSLYTRANSLRIFESVASLCVVKLLEFAFY
jgi:hypothetical protein